MTTFSIIIPVYNDPGGLTHTVTSIQDINCSSEDYEIIIIDNASTDNTREVIMNLVQNNENISSYVENEIQSSYAARNLGIRKSSGEYLIFIDADMSVPPNWITKIKQEIDLSNADYIGYDVDIYIPRDQKTIIGEYNKLSGFPVKTYMERWKFAPTCSLVVRRCVFEKVGLFDPNLISSGDLEFGQRVYHSEYTQYYTNKIVLRHPARTKFQSLLRKSIRIGIGKQQLYDCHPAISGSRPCWHIFNILPPSPVNNMHKYRSVSGWKIVLFYLLDYVFKLGRLYGRIYEKISTFFENND